MSFDSVDDRRDVLDGQARSAASRYDRMLKNMSRSHSGNSVPAPRSDVRAFHRAHHIDADRFRRRADRRRPEYAWPRPGSRSRIATDRPHHSPRSGCAPRRVRLRSRGLQGPRRRDRHIGRRSSRPSRELPPVPAVLRLRLSRGSVHRDRGGGEQGRRRRERRARDHHGDLQARSAHLPSGLAASPATAVLDDNRAC